MSETVTYALWLQPSGDIAYQLQQRIKKLSQKHQTPVFAPHVTLLSGISGTETSVIPLVNTLASSADPFELALTKAGYRDRYYQSLFVHVKENSQLNELRGNSCRLFNISENDYMPHLSLLYGDLTQNEKERILNLTGREFHIQFPVNSIVVMRIGKGPQQWVKVHTSVFKEH